MSAHMAARLSTELGSAIPGELVADVVRGVLDEHRHDAHQQATVSLMREARHRLERFQRARAYNATNRRSAGPHWNAS
ncbi:MAG: hypothetical protein ACXV2H_06400 [Actinomycetes bacterium]